MPRVKLTTEAEARDYIDKWLQESDNHGLSWIGGEWCAFVYIDIIADEYSPIIASGRTYSALAAALVAREIIK